MTNTGSQGRLPGDGLWRIIEEPRSKEFLRVISKGSRDGSRNHLEPGVMGTKDAGLVSRTLAPSEDLAFAKGLLLTPPPQWILSTPMTCGVCIRGKVLQSPPPPSLMALAELVLFPGAGLAASSWAQKPWQSG